MELKKRGFYFTMDALIALMIIMGVLFTIQIIPKKPQLETYAQEDLMNMLSSIKMYEINNSYVEVLRNEGKISENKTLLEQIAEFYAKGMPEARLLTENILSDLSPNQNIGIWFGNELIASENKTPYSEAKEIHVSKQIISGIEKGNVTGYSAKAYLKQSNVVEYYYFGGYIGDGNISLRIDYDGDLKNIDLEIAINKEFDLKINNQYSGHYSESPSASTPQRYDLSSYSSYFHSGQNTIEFLGENLYIAGGYFKLTYKKDVNYGNIQKHFIPGVDGLINIYDGLNFPENLTGMNMSLHFVSPYNIFVKIGNQTIYKGNSSSETIINIDNSSLSGILDYSSLEEKTIPFRIGMENVSYIENKTGIGDVFSVTDLSGSMVCDVQGWICDLGSSWCNWCGGTWQLPMDSAKEANHVFINSILNISGNRVGLVGYRSEVYSSDIHELSTDNESLHELVNNWYASGGTCICCGINEAASKLATSSEDRVKAMVVMSDGQANEECSQQGTGSATQDAIQAACDAYNNYGIIVYAIGFGSGADETTLQAIADCGHGEYYFGDVSNIVELYQNISEKIINASYKEQTLEYSGYYGVRLWPDSYVEFESQQQEIPYGLIVSAESNYYNSSSMVNFNIPENTTPIEAFSTSYSGSKWTKNLNIKNSSWQNIYNLSDYGEDYTKLGDPFVIKIPREKISEGNNLIELETGFSQSNSSGASASDKIIYSVLKNALVYSPISATAEGCNWTIEFEDNSLLYVNVPSDYAGGKSCEYSSSQISYNPNDAIDYSVYNLLKELDLDLDGKVDTKFDENSLNISSSKIGGIPYTYKSEIQIRIWK